MSDEQVLGEGDVIEDGKNSEPSAALDEGSKTFTQEELDAAIRDRLKREQKKYADYKDLKDAASKWEKHQESQKSEMDKLIEAKEKLEKERDDAIRQANDTIIKSAFVAEASKLGAQHPSDAYLLVDLSEFEVKDGKVDGVDKVVKDLVDSGRLPTRASTPKSPDINASTGGKAGSKADLSDEQKAVLAAKYGVKPQYIT